MVLPLGRAPPRSVRPADRSLRRASCSSRRRRATASPSTSSTASGDEGIALLERAFKLMIASHDVRERMRKARVRDIGKARAQGLINDAEAAQLEAARQGGRGRDRGRRFRAGGDCRPRASAWETCYRQPHVATERSGMNGRPVYIVDGSRTPFIKARGGRAVHAGRSRGRLRAAAAAAPAVRARCVRPGDPRLRQRDRRRDEPGARRGAAARHGRGDDRLHRADQLRLRHAVDRHGLPVHPRGQGRPDPGRRRGSAEPRAAGVPPERGRAGTAAMFGARDLWSRLKAIAGFRPSFLKPVIGLERGLTDPVVDLNMGQTAEILAHVFHISRRDADEYAVESQQRLAKAQKEKWFDGRARAGVRARRQGLRSRRRRAAGQHGREARRAQAGVRAAVGQGDGRQQLADHRRRLLGDPRVGGRGQAARPHAARDDRRQRMVGARSVGHGTRAGAVRRPRSCAGTG